MKRILTMLCVLGVLLCGAVQTAQAVEYKLLPNGFTDGTPIDSSLRANGINITTLNSATTAATLAQYGFRANTEVGLTYLGGISWDNNLLVSKASGSWTTVANTSTLIDSWKTTGAPEYTGLLGDFGMAYLAHVYNITRPQSLFDNPAVPNSDGYRFKLMLVNEDFTWFPAANLSSKAITVKAGSILVGFEDGIDLDNNDLLFAMTRKGPATVPVPGAVWLLGTGLAGLVAMRRKKTSN